MSLRRRSLFAVLAVAAFLGLLIFGLLAKGSSGPQLGDPAPVSSLPLLGEEGQASLEDYRGKWVLVNFWASWCAPCRDESPALEALQKRYGGENFTVLGIGTRDLTDDGLAFIREFGLSYPQLRDGDGAQAREWGTTGVPESFLIDPDGVLRAAYPGAVDERVLDERFVSLFEADTKGGKG